MYERVTEQALYYVFLFRYHTDSHSSWDKTIGFTTDYLDVLTVSIRKRTPKVIIYMY